jgi:cobalamin biosynthesis protein CobD/CbiB
METRRWTNPTQPQTLQIAVFLLYFDAIFGALGGLLRPLTLAAAAGSAGAGYGIANDRRWGYTLGLVMAFFPFVFRLALGASLLGFSVINLMFEVALVALLLHPQSRDYQRIWFS